MAIQHQCQRMLQLESYSMDQYRLCYHGYGYDLVDQLDHMLVNRLMFILGHIWRLMARLYLIEQKQLLGFYLMGQLLQHYYGYEYGLVVQLNRSFIDQFQFNLVRI